MIGKKLKELIRQRGIKQVELARYVGISPSRLSNYLSDKREPDLEMLARMAKFMSVDLNYFSDIRFTARPENDYATISTGGYVVAESSASYGDDDSSLVPLLPVNAKKRATHNVLVPMGRMFLEGVTNPDESAKLFEVNNPPAGSSVRDGDYLIAASCGAVALENGDMLMESGRNCRFFRYYHEAGIALLVSDDDERETVRVSDSSMIDDYYKILWVVKKPR